MKPRPSSLELSFHCPRAPWLSEVFQESSDAAAHGREVHAQIAAGIKAGDLTLLKSQEAKHCWRFLEWWLAQDGRNPEQTLYMAEDKVQLTDPEAPDVVLTEGTPDVYVVHGDTVWVWDWKSAEQWRAGLLPPTDENWQLLAYLAALMLRYGSKKGRVVVVPYDENGVEPQWSKWFADTDVMGIIDHIKTAPDVNPAGPEPEAHMGDHCRRCYRRFHCSAWMLPPVLPPGDAQEALVPLTVPSCMTNQEALGALEWLGRAKLALKQAKDLTERVEDALEAHSQLVGPIGGPDGKWWGPIPTKGRRTGPTVKECEAAGLTHLIKEGEPGVKYGWRKP